MKLRGGANNDVIVHMHIAFYMALHNAVHTKMEFEYNKLQKYEPPDWSRQLAYQPESYVQLCVRPTPIHHWDVPGLPKEFQLFIKRDDMTGSTLGGNKIRQLEFLMAEALRRGCDNVITCGGIQSNLSRIMAVAAAQLGLKPHLVFRTTMPVDPENLGCSGNLLLIRAVGTKLILVPPKEDGSLADYSTIYKMIDQYVEKLTSEGATPYVIPSGGCNEIGTWSYIEAFRELMKQDVMEKFDDIVLPIGSGGTACGLALANHLTGSKLRVHAVCICDDAALFHKDIDMILDKLGLSEDSEERPAVQSKDIIDIIDGYKGYGNYGPSTDEELVQLLEISSQTGIILDPVYSLKGVRGMLTELKKNPKRFKGNRILYIHTGGLFGAYDGRLEKALRETPSSNQVSNF